MNVTQKTNHVLDNILLVAKKLAKDTNEFNHIMDNLIVALARWVFLYRCMVAMSITIGFDDNGEVSVQVKRSVQNATT